MPTGPLRDRSGTRTGSARSTGGRAATARTSSPRTGTTRRTGPVHVRPQLRLVTAPVGTPARPRRVAAARPAGHRSSRCSSC
ncbi:hypothetical protein ACFQX8_05285 [Klenkia terrae]|uniref:hypothetical protein n=1 Tax=Klenkia terrae TaxID=1052259 RepID=UPI00361AEAC6